MALSELDLGSFWNPFEIARLLACRHVGSRIHLELHEIVGLSDARIRIRDKECLVEVAFCLSHLCRRNSGMATPPCHKRWSFERLIA